MMSKETVSVDGCGICAADATYVLDSCVEAGKLAVEMRSRAEIRTKSAPEDLVTSADEAVSQSLLEKLVQRFPEDLRLSEEAEWQQSEEEKRRWFIDPIDGTKHYVKDDGRYSVMVGLERGSDLIFGCTYMPVLGRAYVGGKGLPAFTWYEGVSSPLSKPLPLPTDRPVRALISKNDLAANQWLLKVQGLEILTATSIGLDLHELISGTADVFVHIRPTLKYWDTAAPGAIALAAGFEVGTECGTGIPYGPHSPTHENCIVIGRPGAIAWWSAVWRQRQTAESASASKEQDSTATGGN